MTGLNDGNFTVRGFPADEVGVTVNGVPINDSGNYKMYATEYGDTENMGDITVEQGYPSCDLAGDRRGRRQHRVGHRGPDRGSGPGT